ncbi:hypothetical protein BN1050_02509 [Metalysinibacillus saudimassiliensis]|uniref:DUF1444 domain-containing protein n=1 Tax=Metalysinibacillus saudimassiliensis TaxID=1461583 RepID=A0A078MGW5_9BACL|nr:hypothetical protein BN1050_02509 [Metalysinibacillus saudimassiliensis]
MKEQQMVEEIKKRLGGTRFTYTFDEKGQRLHLQHTVLQRGMDIAISQVVAKYQEKKEAAIDEVIYTIEQTFTAMEQEQQQGFTGKAKIYPVVRSTSFPQQSKEGVAFVTTEHTAETRIFYALDLGSTYRLIDERMLEQLQMTTQQVKEAARFAVTGLGTEVKRDEVAGSVFYFINYNDGYDASRILNEKFLQEMKEQIEGDMTLSVPHQDVLIIGDIRDEVGYDVLAQLTMHYFSVGMVPITSLSFVYNDGELEPIFILAKNKNTKGE